MPAPTTMGFESEQISTLIDGAVESVPRVLSPAFLEQLFEAVGRLSLPGLIGDVGLAILRP